MLREGEGIPMNKPLAAQYFKRAAAQGHSAAGHALLDMLERGDVVAADLDPSTESRDFDSVLARALQAAADGDSAKAQLLLAELLLSGVAPDRAKAEHYMRRTRATLMRTCASGLRLCLVRWGGSTSLKRETALGEPRLLWASSFAMRFLRKVSSRSPRSASRQASSHSCAAADCLSSGS
jgi:hypothetical protein